MAEIVTAQGKIVLIDDDDLPIVESKRWQAYGGPECYYAVNISRINGKLVSTYMHRLIIAPPSGMVIDHMNGNGLDNRRSNLRIATHAQNNQNRKMRAGSEVPFKGVCRTGSKKNPYCVRMRIDGKSAYIGSYPTAEEAALTYDRMAIKLHGEFALLNFPNFFSKKLH